MSNGLRDAFGYCLSGDDKIDLFSDEEITEILKDFKPQPKLPWLDYGIWKPKEYKCTCGSEKIYGKNAAHSSWCDSK